MAEAENHSQESIKPFVDAVRQALFALRGPGTLAGPRPVGGSQGAGVETFEFSSILGSDEPVKLPRDSVRPYDEDVSLYIVKQMEFVESFLIAKRLSNDLRGRDESAELHRLHPPGVRLEKFIEIALRVVGRGIDDAKRNTEKLRYYPYPQLSARIDIPFVDFAGLLIKVLTDYVVYAGVDDDSPLVRAARAEIETAVEFLISETTYIDDGEDRIAWAFVPRVECEEVRGGAPANRHILPTAWALFGLSRHFLMDNANEDLKRRSQEILPRVLNWVLSLQTDEGLFSSGEQRSSPSLATHNYNVEAWISLRELQGDPPDDVLAESVSRFVKKLETVQGDFYDADISFDHRVKTNDTPYTSYTDRTTTANFLATLSTAIGYLEGMGGDHSDVAANARQVSALLATHVMEDRRDDAGLWQRGQMQFHWVLSAIEGLLRYSRFGRVHVFETSSDAVVQAIDYVLQDKKFATFFRTELLNAITRMSQHDRT